MTNKEIMQADLLDIIFEKRNKDYGAYALRRGYNHRLLTAIGAAMSVILLFVIIDMISKKNSSSIPVNDKYRVVEITEINLPREKPNKPEQLKVPVKQVVKMATIAYTSRIVIKPNDQVKVKVPDIASLDGKAISDKTQDGKKEEDIPRVIEQTVETGIATATGPSATQPDFTAIEKDPEFPGGPEALKRFLANNLETPVNLEDGEKKTVHIRFKVDKDGSVNTFEIITSGGNEFDNEVVRVCKRMPRWIPALQNGIHVPVSYVLPVTFIGVEQ